MDSRFERVGIIGSGCAGLITAHTLLRDGFTDVVMITRDRTVGGTWAEERVYPGLTVNSVHGEFRFSSLQMPDPTGSLATGGRLTGNDLCLYFKTFAETHLFTHKAFSIRLRTNVADIRREDGLWSLRIEDLHSDAESEILTFSRIVLCTGGNNTPNIPPSLCSTANGDFRGPIIHSSDFAMRREGLIEFLGGEKRKTVVIIGGGKSSQDVSSALARALPDVRIQVVYDKTDSPLASKNPLPMWIRKGRFFSILTGYSTLETRLERFLHKTWIGSKIIEFIFNTMLESSFSALSIPEGSPLRHVHNPFWSLHTNDEGVPRPDSYFSLVNQGRIEVISHARAMSLYSTTEDPAEQGVTTRIRRPNKVEQERQLKADAIVLATGYMSSWETLFDDSTRKELGLSRRPIPIGNVEDEWKDCISLSSPPPHVRATEERASCMYRGMIPVDNFARRDFAINGGVFVTNNGYTCEVCSHWISSYFLRDSPLSSVTAEEARKQGERNARWMRKRWPGMLNWANESYTTAIEFFTWPQYVDTLLQDMGLRNMRSGGNWLTWIFKVIDVDEILNLKEERDAARMEHYINREIM